MATRNIKADKDWADRLADAVFGERTWLLAEANAAKYYTAKQWAEKRGMTSCQVFKCLAAAQKAGRVESVKLRQAGGGRAYRLKA